MKRNENKYFGQITVEYRRLNRNFQCRWGKGGHGSSPRYRTQTYQLLSTLNPTRSLSRNAGLLVSYTNYLIPPQTTSAANLKLHTNLSSNPDTPPVSTSVNLPNSTLVPAALKVLIQSPVFYCWGRPLWSGQNIHFRFVSSLYIIATLTYRLDDSLVYLR